MEELFTLEYKIIFPTVLGHHAKLGNLYEKISWLILDFQIKR